jgi:hypothetical protein
VHLNRGLQESGLSAADYEILAVLSGTVVEHYMSSERGT